jgi:MFS family permease
VPRDAKLFLLSSSINGFTNGIFNVIIQLYYTSLGFEGSLLGDIFMMGPLGAAILTIPAGIVADRYGKSRIWLVGMCISFSAFLIVVTSQDYGMLRLAHIMFGISNATSVVFGPIYSGFFEKEDLDRAFGTLNFINITMMSAGNLMGHIPPILMNVYLMTKTSAYYWTLMVAVVLSIINSPLWYMAIRNVKDSTRVDGFKIVLKSKSLVAKSAALNLASTLGRGVFFSLFPYYIYTRFNVESDALGNLFMASNIVMAISQFIAPRISARYGNLRTSALAIILTMPFYAAIGFAPSFGWVTALYVLRFGVGSISSPLVGSFFMGRLKDEEKSTANSISNMGFQIGNFLSPWLGGRLMDASLNLPIWVGLTIYSFYAFGYFPLMRAEERKEEKATESTQPA